MSEVWVNQWEHRVGPASKWEAIFFQVEGIPTPVPWWTREAGPHQEAVTHEDMIAAASLLSKQPLPFKMEASFTEYPSKKNPGRTERRIDDWEIIDGQEHIQTSVVVGKGADERPHSPPESEAATGLPPAAPPKATTPTPVGLTDEEANMYLKLLDDCYNVVLNSKWGKQVGLETLTAKATLGAALFEKVAPVLYYRRQEQRR